MDAEGEGEGGWGAMVVVRGCSGGREEGWMRVRVGAEKGRRPEPGAFCGARAGGPRVLVADRHEI